MKNNKDKKIKDQYEVLLINEEPEDFDTHKSQISSKEKHSRQ